MRPVRVSAVGGGQDHVAAFEARDHEFQGPHGRPDLLLHVLHFNQQFRIGG